MGVVEACQALDIPRSSLYRPRQPVVVEPEHPNETTADKAEDLQARYDLTLADACQIPTEKEAGCDSFLANDVEFKRVTDIPNLIVSE